MRLTLILISTALTLILSGCGSTIRNEDKYYRWINDESNHLKVVKETNGFILTFKYMPPELLAYNEYSSARENDQFVNKDSLINIYKNSLAFIFTIEDSGNKDIMYYDVRSEQDFKQRILEFNFKLQDYVSIKGGTTEFVPVLCIMESTYETKNSRSFYMVFSDNENKQNLLEQEKFDIVFNDLFFNTGISHFTFSKHDFDKVPKIGFWNK
jgi:hypothetical protein